MTVKFNLGNVPVFVQLDEEWMGYGRVLAAVLGGKISPLFLLNLTLEMEPKGSMIYVNFCSLLVNKFWVF